MWPRGHTLQATAGTPPADVRPPTGDVTGEAVAKLKQAPRALAPELVRASCVWQEYYVISIESEDVNMRIRKNILMTLAIMLIATAPAWSQSLLKTLDPDHDGTVDLAETKSAASKLFDKLDRDHDGTLDKRELRGRLNAKDFAAADPDNDGTLDKNEFLALVEKRFNAANPDNDGTLDAKELKTAAGRSLARLLK
jgi:Ca2+-binding EF-hand superfamily protein